MSTLAMVVYAVTLFPGQTNPAISRPSSSNSSPNRETGPSRVEKPVVANEIPKRFVSPDPGPKELLAPSREINDRRVRLVPEVQVESIPQYLPGKSEFGTTRQDVRIQYREEKQVVTTMKLRTVERQVEVLSRRTILKGEIDPTTGEKATNCRQVTVPVLVTMSCQVLEPVSEEIVVRVPEVQSIESPILVRRYGLLTGEKSQVAKRYRAVLFDDPIPVPPCLDDGRPGDPLGRPESPGDMGGPQPRPSPVSDSVFPHPLPSPTPPKPNR